MKLKLITILLLASIGVMGQTSNVTVKRLIASPNTVTGVVGAVIDTIPITNGAGVNNYVLQYKSALNKFIFINPSTLTPTLSTTTISLGATTNGMSVSSGVFRLHRVNASNGGVFSTGTDTIPGDKQFNGSVTFVPTFYGSSGSLTGNMSAFGFIGNATSGSNIAGSFTNNTSNVLAPSLYAKNNSTGLIAGFANTSGTVATIDDDGSIYTASNLTVGGTATFTKVGDNNAYMYSTGTGGGQGNVNFKLGRSTTSNISSLTFGTLLTDDWSIGQTASSLDFTINKSGSAANIILGQATTFSTNTGTGNKLAYFNSTGGLLRNDNVTIPGGTGTLALTSDIPTASDYWTTNTTQTGLTGNKTTSGTITAGGFVGALTGNATTATSSTNSAITDDVTTNATMYPLWVTANTGNLPIKVSSTKMTFNPSTGALTSTTLNSSGRTTIGAAAFITGFGNPASGAGVVIDFQSLTGRALAYDFTAGVYRTMQVQGSTVTLLSGATTALTASGSTVTFGGLASFSQTGTEFIGNTGASTATKLIRIANTSGDGGWGVEGATSTLISAANGGVAYSTVLKTVGATDLILGTNSIRGFKMDGSTQATTFYAAMAGTSGAFSGNLSGNTITAANGFVASSNASGSFFGKFGASGTTTLELRDFDGTQTAATLITRSSATTGFNHIESYNGSSTKVFQVLANGNVQNTSNSYGAISDRKVKTNITDMAPQLANIMKLKIRDYNLIPKFNVKERLSGVIADELKPIYPTFINTTADRDEKGKDLGTVTSSVSYSYFIPVMLKAMQEQQAEIEKLKQAIKTKTP